jgi:hypothetical protein
MHFRKQTNGSTWHAMTARLVMVILMIVVLAAAYGAGEPQFSSPSHQPMAFTLAEP